MTDTTVDMLPEDAASACLVGRVWISGEHSGPRPVAVRDGELYDLSGLAPTMADLCDLDNPAAAVNAYSGNRLCSLEEAAAGARLGGSALFQLLAPCDLQAIKAAGVTFADSLLERVIEERAKGDPQLASTVRADLEATLGVNIRTVKPGSPESASIKTMLLAKGWWSQYLEVGLGPDAEVFTKSQPMSAVGWGAEIGLHSKSAWNNPEPEYVLACNARGEVVGASLGNDVNLRDFEGRSALLLSKAKDNNASCAIGPFIRLLDRSFNLDAIRADELSLTVQGEDGFVMRGTSTMSRISRDPLDLVEQTFGPHHQYPDGAMLFLGTLFAPTQDRDAPGGGFTHHLGDVVTIQSRLLGALSNRVTTSDRAAPWTFGARALMRSLAQRGLL